MRFLNDLNLVTKVAIPTVILVAVMALVVWQAKAALDTMAERNRAVIEGTIAQRMHAKELLAAVAEVTIQEKNIIIETDEVRLEELRRRFDDASRNTFAVLDRLHALAEDDAARADIADLKADVDAYFAVLQRSVSLGFANRGAEALAVSKSEGRDARMAVVRAVEERVERIAQAVTNAKAAAETLAASTSARLLSFSVAGILFAVGLLVAIIVYAVARPVAAVTKSLVSLSEGDLAVDVVGAGRKDEVGSLARALETFKANAIEARRLAAEQAADMEAKVRRAAALDRMTREFEASTAGLIQTLSGSATELEATASAMTATAEQTNRNSGNVASAAEQTSANVQTVATATEELATSIREIARQVSHSSTIAGTAVENAKQADGMVAELAAGAEAIGNVVSLINTIAAQTNLLALNATIEAARAGEAGRGFAVVAAEVKALAGQTTKATDDIAVQVNAIQAATDRVVGAIRQIGSVIDQMSDISTGIAAAVEEQGVATEDIARSVQEAARGTELVTGNISDVREGAGHTGAAAAQVLSAARELSRRSNDLGREVADFLAGIKAA